ncbi:hypothetical protein [Flavobacterium sp.]|jgi:hypothetical protein|uniref:hypothetical protein n=1 Tax=Flavobacterium sp. TaxID=239 RepID=UPI002A83D091|nr:hypothetical protein [Flavobacterium sp.]
MKPYKNYIGFLALICLFISCKKEAINSENDDLVSGINTPIPKADIKYDAYKINPNKDTVIYHKSGAVLEIPKNAFLNSKGEVVTDFVDVQFRTLSNPLEIYLAGVPMNFTTNKKVQLVFESAGMFEINANLPEENLRVNPKNKINVTLNSFSNDSNFNTYDLENDTKVWVETGKDKISESSKEEALAKLPELPIAPKLSTKAAFQIIDEREESNTLAEYKDVWFEPIDGKQVRNSTKDIKIKDLKNGTYEVTFHSLFDLNENSETKVICRLAFNNDKEYSKALKKYQNKYAKRIKEDKDKRDKIERDWTIYNNQLEEYRLFFAKNEIQKTKGSQKIIRSLEVNKFGFVNIDRPIDFPQGGNISPIYVDENNNKIALKEIVLVETGRNSLYRYKNEIKFNPENDNLLWGLTNEGKLAYFTKEDFKQIKKNKGKVNLKMRIHPIELTSYDEIITVLFPK